VKYFVNSLVAFALILTPSLAQRNTSEMWRPFMSSRGFSVVYPGSWFRRGASKDSLSIVSSKGGAEALIIKHGQGLISVVEEGASTRGGIEAVIDRYVGKSTLLSRRKIRNSRAAPQGCDFLEELIVREPAVPPEDVPGSAPNLIYTEYFCAIGQHKYVAILKNYEGDRLQRDYRAVALRVAESIRLTK